MKFSINLNDGAYAWVLQPYLFLWPTLSSGARVLKTKLVFLKVRAIDPSDLLVCPWEPRVLYLILKYCVKRTYLYIYNYISMDLVIWSTSLFLSINAVGYNLIYSYNHFNINWSPIWHHLFFSGCLKINCLKVIYRKSNKHRPMINVLNVINLLLDCCDIKWKT